MKTPGTFEITRTRLFNRQKTAFNIILIIIKENTDTLEKHSVLLYKYSLLARNGHKNDGTAAFVLFGQYKMSQE